MPEVNYIAVLVAAIAAFAWGAFYYSPAAAGKMWMKEMGMKEMGGEGAAKMMAIGFVATLVMAYVLSHVVWMSAALDIGTGVTTGFWVWLGFIATLTTGDVTWGGKTWKLWFINNVHWLVALVIMGAIISAMS